MSALTLRHRLEYAGLRFLVAVVSRLPEWAAWTLGGFLGRLAGSILRIRRSVVDGNLRRAFPNADAGWRRKVARRTYLHFAREFVQLMRLGGVTAEILRERVAVDGIDLVRGPLAEGRGVVVLTAHLGNWEMGAAGLTVNGVELAAVAKRQTNPLFDEYIRGVRERIGMSVVYQSEATRRVIKLLRGAGAVALVSDQNAGRAGIFVDFFGVPASTVRGPAVLAARTDAEVVFAAPMRLPGVLPRYRLGFSDVDWDRGDDPDEEVRNLIATFMERLEDAIRVAPEQYFWFHKRWKTRPPEGEVGDEGAGGGPMLSRASKSPIEEEDS